MEAFSLLFDLDTSAAQQKQVFRIMRRTLRKMCLGGGEHRLLTTQDMADVEEYVKLLDQKTATLMSACCECSAILTGNPSGISQQMADFGTYFGIAFQVADDLRDQDALLKKGVELVPIVSTYAQRAKNILSPFQNVPAKHSLIHLCDMLLPTRHSFGIFEQKPDG